MTATTITIQTIPARRHLLNRRLVTALGNNGRNAASAKPSLTPETFDPNFLARGRFCQPSRPRGKPVRPVETCRPPESTNPTLGTKPKSTKNHFFFLIYSHVADYSAFCWLVPMCVCAEYGWQYCPTVVLFRGVSCLYYFCLSRDRHCLYGKASSGNTPWLEMAT
jgi:hypothetical protein